MFLKKNDHTSAEKINLIEGVLLTSRVDLNFQFQNPL